MKSARQDPRANQKARTRAAIVDAAQRRRADTGDTPTVAEAAAVAGVSRATAYRYFPTQESLELEVADITPDVAATEATLAELETRDVEERLLTLVDALNPVAFAKEAHFRRALWVYQDTWLRSERSGQEPPAIREGRRMRWLDQVLEPLDAMPDDRKRRLRAALALTLGGDALVVMKDVCRLDDDEALDVLRWTAAAILRAGLAEYGLPPDAGAGRGHPQQ
jgi:AcrR family transcriptional regulator